MLAKLFNNNKNTGKGLCNLITNLNVNFNRNFNLNVFLSYQKFPLSTSNNNNFDLLDKEINQVKKLNSEYKTNKTLIKKRLNKEKYVNNTPHVKTEEISNKIEEIKNKKRSDLNAETQKIPESFKSFFDDSAFDGELGKGHVDKGIKLTEKGVNTKPKGSESDPTGSAVKRIKVEEVNENADLDEIEKKILNREKTRSNLNQKNFKDNYIERGKDSGKPYKNLRENLLNNNNKPKSKFNHEEYDKNPSAGFDDKKAYSNMLKYSKMKDEKFMTEEEKSNKKINHLLDNLFNFNSDFCQIKPLETKIIHENKIDAEDNDDLEAEDPKVKKAVENVRSILQTKRIRERGAVYIINVLFSIYRSLIPKEEKAANLSRENTPEKRDNKDLQEQLYFKKIQNKLDDSKQKFINEVFSQNEIIEGIHNIVSHINTLKGDDMEKLINILNKINYFNFGKWKQILEEYLLHLSMYSDTSYQLYSSKELSQIMVHLKNLEENLLLGKDNFSVSKEANLKSNIKKEEILALVKKAFEKSSECFMKDLEFKKVEFFSINMYMVVMAKYRLLDEKVSKKIENAILPIVDTLGDSDLCNLMFNVFKNKLASEKFFVKLEKKAEALLSEYLGEQKSLDTYLVTLIAKSILSGMRNNHTLLLLLEDLYIKNKKKFAVHQTITIAYTLVSLDSGSSAFVKEIDNFLSSYDKKPNLTELLCYQVVTILIMNSEFSEANLVEYMNLYKKFIDRNQVKPKQLKYLGNELKGRLRNFQGKPAKEGGLDVKKFLDDYYKEISAKNNFFKYKN